MTPEEASRYLEELSHHSALSGLRVETHVHAAKVSDVARSVVEHSAELAPDLIAMSPHGKGSVRRLLFGDESLSSRCLAIGRGIKQETHETFY